MVKDSATKGVPGEKTENCLHSGKYSTWSVNFDWQYYWECPPHQETIKW